MKFIVEGKLDSSGKVVQDNSMFNASVMIGDQVVGQSQVSSSGEYKVEFESETRPDAVDVQIGPSSVKPEDAGRMALTKRVSSSMFSAVEGKDATFTVKDKFYLPIKYLDYIRVRTSKYHVFGTVYLEHDTYFTTLPGCRVDFYEVDYASLPTLPQLPTLPSLPGSDSLELKKTFPFLRRQDFLGSAYTRADGSYDFDFRFGSFPLKKPLPRLDNEFTPHLPERPVLPESLEIPDLSEPIVKPDFFIDFKPDIQARFFLYIDGVWTHVHTAPMMDFDWNIDREYHRDYQIPADAADSAIEPGEKPATGFFLKSIGLIPIDNTRIVDGYIHSQPGDPLANINHEPLCGTLRIHGLFADVPPVARYLVERLRTDATGTAITGETWTPLESTLPNMKWDDSVNRWVTQHLAEGGGRYRNIDIEDPLQWLEPSLKVVWNTAGRVNGYYILRFTGFDGDDVEVVSKEMPMICIDNDKPQASIDVIAPPATICGDLTLGTERNITFRVTAYDAEGHLHSYYINGSRGRYGETAGPQFFQGTENPGGNWSGVIGGAVPFTINERTSRTITCSTMAYSFHLCVQGAGTNGYGHNFASKRECKRTNLVVTE